MNGTGANMTDIEIIEDKKTKISNFLNNLYLEKCKKNYQKYVEMVEEYEKRGKIPTYYIPRENIRTIWSDANENIIKEIEQIELKRQQNRQNPNQNGNG